MYLLSHVWLFVTPWTVACRAPLSMKFSRQEYGSSLPCPPPGDLPDPRIETTFLCVLPWQADSLPLCHLGSPICGFIFKQFYIHIMTIKSSGWDVQLLSVISFKKHQCYCSVCHLLTHYVYVTTFSLLLDAWGQTKFYSLVSIWKAEKCQKYIFYFSPAIIVCLPCVKTYKPQEHCSEWVAKNHWPRKAYISIGNDSE